MERPLAAQGQGAAATLLGSLACLLATFYLVHRPGDEAQRRARTLIGSGTSAFSAALLVRAACGAMDELLLPGLPAWASPALRALLALLCYEVLQLALAYASDAASPAVATDTRDVEATEADKRVLAAFFGHAAGFSAVAALETTQAVAVVVLPGVPGWKLALALVPCAWVALQTVFRANAAAREWATAPGRGVSPRLGALGGVPRGAGPVWDEGAVAAEDTVVSLSVSFLLARAVSSPAAAASIGEALSVGDWGPPATSAGHGAEALRPLGAALLLGGAAALLGAVRRGGRARALCEAVAASACAWTAFGGLLAGLRNEAFGAARGPLAAVHLALVCTAVAFAGAVAARPSETSTGALGLLSGLAWARACGEAAATAAARAPSVPGVPAATLEQALGVLICAMVVPTWRVAAFTERPRSDAESERGCARAVPPELVGGARAPLLGVEPEPAQRPPGEPGPAQRPPGGLGDGLRAAGEEAEHARREEATTVHQRSVSRQLQEADAAMSSLRAALHANADVQAAAGPTSPAFSMPPSADGKASDSDRPPLLRTLRRISVAHGAVEKDLREGCAQMRKLQGNLEDEEERLVAIEASLSGAAAEALERLGQLRGRLAAPPSEPCLSSASLTESVRARNGTKVRTYPLPQVPHAGVEVHTFPFAPPGPS